MLRRVLTLAAGVALAGAVAATPAQAASLNPVERQYSPIHAGSYCMANVSPSSFVMLYRSTGLVCLLGGGSVPVNPTAVCQWFNPGATILNAYPGYSESLMCRLIPA
ncbi:hypothetical protein SAMN05421505_12955 [Sinosporangium album]|uniref:Uncharacterized protein n=1 Tax=Sinosporangium album TaxID=504805 RepID=A0A1G8GX23_9ACTN|nr:hypothetical protein [Sinosporangium album]SDH98932.1 hypothetical protein SAMN05421505_12955 [Sinosporangium album]